MADSENILPPPNKPLTLGEYYSSEERSILDEMAKSLFPLALQIAAKSSVATAQGQAINNDTLAAASQIALNMGNLFVSIRRVFYQQIVTVKEVQ
jgi:hypothetical protein